jgi:ribosomal protein S18 acetylase RimI-like enzyme
MTDLHLEIRPIRTPDDFPALADLATRIYDWHTTPEDLAREERNREPQYHHAEYVAEILEGNQKRVVGATSVGHDRFSHEDGKFRVGIMVHPDYQARGIGASLWETAWNHLSTMQPKKLVNMTRSDSERGLQMLEHRGFKQVWERVESRLDPKGVDFSQYADLDSTVETLGIRIVALSDITDEDRIRKLYDLDLELLLDVPFGQAVTPEPFEVWARNFESDPHADPRSIWIAIKDNEWIAMSSLEKNQEFFVIGMTGVKAAYRGLGLAKRLKLEGVRFALGNGGLEIRTYNDHVNTAMLEMNRSMGFERFRSMLRFEKLL